AEPLRFKGDVLTQWDTEIDFSYGKHINTTSTNHEGFLELDRIRPVTIDNFSGFERTQRGWSYAYGSEIEVTESVVLNSVEALLSTNIPMKMAVTIWEQ